MTSTPPEPTRPEPVVEPQRDTATDTRPDTPVDPLRGSRTSGAWIGLGVVAVLLVLLIVFIAQNTQKVQVSFLGWSGQTPLAVAILASVVTGLVVAAIAGSLRILQLRRRVRRSAQ